MKVLTIQEPWLTAILHGGKRTENRSYRPHPSVIGERIGLHASKKLAPKWQWEWSLAHGVYVQSNRTYLGCIAATAVVVGYVRVTGFGANREYDVTAAPKHYHPEVDTWLVKERGNIGWILEDVQLLPEPIPALGKLQLWDYALPA
jgi:hypothetical protein